MIKVFFDSMRDFNIKYRHFAWVYIALAAVAAVANVISIRATGDMTQAAELGVTSDMMSFLIVLAIAGLVNTLLLSVMDLVNKRFFGRAIYTIRKAFAGRLLVMPYKDFSVKNSGEGASLFTADIPQAASFLSTQAFLQVSQITTLAVSVVYMMFINWWLTLAYFAFFPVLAILQAIIATPIGKKREEASKKRADYNSVVTDALQNPLTVMAYGLEASVERRFTESYKDFYKAQYSAVKTTAGLALVGIFATFLPILSLFFAASALVISGNMTIAEFIALSIISSPVATWLTMFAQDLARLQTAKASLVRVTQFVPDLADEKVAMAAAIEADSSYAAVFDNVTFGYGSAADDGADVDGAGNAKGAGGADDAGDTSGAGGADDTDDAVDSDDAGDAGDVKVFDEVSFTIDKGGITAIAGPSGSGKSTALKLILGLYTPDQGSISLSSENITYVPQDCQLLPVSIRENVTAGLPHDEEKLRTACENAGIYEFIANLDNGFDSVLVESAANVSGGQKQRLAMARAFYRDADILLFDEATSALDPVTEQAVLESFARYIKENGKTAIVVAHRQAVLDMADKVITFRSCGTPGEEGVQL